MNTKNAGDLLLRRGNRVVSALLVLAVITAALLVDGTAVKAVKIGGEAAKIGGNPVVQGNNDFAFDLYQQLKTRPGNLFFSPYSISTALAMTYAGAGGDTAEQMADVLHFTLKSDKLHSSMGRLVNKLNDAGEESSFQLVVSNALWGQKGYSFLPSFLGFVKNNYTAGFNEVDFIHQTEATRKTINTWVERQTQDKIRELLKPGILTPITRLVLTNAIYFKGNWASQFKESHTLESPFKLGGGKTVTVPLMQQTAKFNYAEGKSLQILELPYVDGRLSMVVLLPKRVDQIGQLEKRLDSKILQGWLSRTREQKVQVYLPRFKMTDDFKLEQVLPGMGMPDAFSEVSADFSGMTGKKDLYISAVIHKAFVDVNEEGTEAAAATAVVMSRKGGHSPVPVFRADHPFVFLIRDNFSGSILFCGRLSNPAE